MKSIFKYILVFSIISVWVGSCAYKEDLLLMNPDNTGGSTLFVASVDDFDRHDVTTKADGNAVTETTIKDLTVLLFGLKGNHMELLTPSPLCVDGEKINFVISTAKDINGDIVSAKLYNVQEASDDKTLAIDIIDELESCKLYIVANMKESFKNKGRMTEAELKSIPYTFTPSSYEDAKIGDVGIPGSGFPMMGSIDVDITKTSRNAIPVPMKKLFAKVNFKFMVRLDADGPGSVNKVSEPYFKPESWRVFNVPTSITIGDDVDGETEAMLSTGAIKNNFKFNIAKDEGQEMVYDSPNENDYFEFSFYMPEHMVTPYRTRESLGISEEEKKFMQCHKPTLCVPQSGDEESKPKYPTYVQIAGSYSDHQGHLTQVTYDLYLGQNEIDDFNVIRNQDLNNIVVIKGITNHNQGTGISCDHRVNVSSSGYSIGLERETLLDSHYEFRPMKITVERGNTVDVKVPKNGWVGAESENDLLSSSSAYDSVKPGLRKYFTTNLISELWEGVTSDYKIFTFEYDEEKDKLQNGGTVTGKVNHTLWFYFDENVNMTYDDSNQSESHPLYRQAIVQVYLNSMNQPDREFAFRQMSLWAINSSGTPARQYGIEYFEEYLYNYASDDNYGVTHDGMEWGLSGQQLSSQYQALYAKDTGVDGDGIISWLIRWFGWTDANMYNNLFAGINIKYDFYIDRDKAPEFSTVRNYNGLNFTKEIVNAAGIDDKILTLSGDDENSRDGETCEGAESAVEYCYNKNKRNPNGQVETIHWYLPAIDETEEILVGGYTYFPVFQSKFYWSSQPSYTRYDFHASVANQDGLGYCEGFYFRDDTSNARATRVTASKDSEESGLKGSLGIRRMAIYPPVTWLGYAGEVRPGSETLYNSSDENYISSPYHIGNQSRKTPNRVRCAYNAEGVSTNN